MTAREHPTWDEAFPETFNWAWLDTPKAERGALGIATAIYQDFRTKERVLVPGLREALRLIAATIETIDS